MTRDIYEQYAASFRGTCANAITYNGEHVANITYKRGDVQLTAYVHWIGLEMVRGTAGGGGYDKASAAIAAAARKLDPADVGARHDIDALTAFLMALQRDGGSSWHYALGDAGFNVLTVLSA